MSFLRNKPKFALFTFFVTLLCLQGALPASATTPNVPSGQQLMAFTWAPQYPVMLDLSLDEAVLSPNTAPESSMSSPEGAGFDSVTNKTWVLTDSCELWELAVDGSTQLIWDLTSTIDASLGYCDALLLMNDGTSYVAGWDSSGGLLMHISLSSGLVIDPPVHAAISGHDAWITGISKSPITGEYWISATDEGLTLAGLYPINLQNGEIDLTRRIEMPDHKAWDIAFDSTGLLWMSLWANADNTFALGTLNVSDPDPISTLYNFGRLNFDGGLLGAGPDAIWFASVDTPEPNPGQGPSAQLANTGTNMTLFYALGFLSIISGLVFILNNQSNRKVNYSK